LLRAKLTTSHETPSSESKVLLVTVCERCQRGGGVIPDINELQAKIESLNDEERTRLNRWVKNGRRAFSPEDIAWIQYGRLPAESRDELKTWLLQSDLQS